MYITVSVNPIDISLTEANFPDVNLRSKVKDFDTNGDGALSSEEIKAVTTIDIDGKKRWNYQEMRYEIISDLSGLEIFTSLVNLNCSNNALTALDITPFKLLEKLECSNNKLTTLDASSCPELVYLDCSRNNINSLNVISCKNLEYLDCGDNKLSALDVHKLNALTYVDCRYNYIATLNTAQCSSLTTFFYLQNSLVSLDVSECTALTSLKCQGYHDSLFEERYCDLIALNVRGCTALQDLDCKYNSITKLEVINCATLISLDCSNNLLTSLDINGCTELITLNCSYNKLNTLDLSDCSSLTRLTCRNQTLSGWTAMQTNDNNWPYQIDFSNYIPNFNAVVQNSVKGYSEYTTINTQYKNGIAKFASQPTKVRYHYTVGYSNTVMDVTVTLKTEGEHILTKPTITTSTLPNGTVGVSYNATLEATGTTPITWTVINGKLPTNLSLTLDGKITGTPTVADTYSFTIQATGTGSDTKAFSIKITSSSSGGGNNGNEENPENPPEEEHIPTKPTITTSTLPNGTVGVSYNATLEATGTTPITWTVINGKLPTNLSLTLDGKITGTPTVADTYSFTIQATGTGSDTKVFSVKITSPSSGGDNNGNEENPENPEDSPDNNGQENDETTDNSSDEDTPNSGGNNSSAPDFEHPEENNAAPNQIEEIVIYLNNGNEIKAGVYTIPVQVTSLETEEVREAIGNTWNNAYFRSVDTDMDQTDDRSDTEKMDIIKIALNANQQKTGKQIEYAYVLQPMKPTKTGIFVFTLPLASDMAVGDSLVWFVRKSQKSLNAVTLGANVTLVAETTDDESAVFIDMETKKEITTIPENRAVSVAIYLYAHYNYEPVILTISDTDSDTDNDNNDNNEHSFSSVSSGGGGCNTIPMSILMFTFSLLLFRRNI